MADYTDDELAPHGRDHEGVPLAPYGLKKDGNPRKSRSGRSAASGTAPAPAKKATPNTKAQHSAGSRAAQKQGLIDLADMLLTPASMAASAPPLRRKYGDKRADAIAGSVVIVESFVPDIAEFATVVGESRPGLLAWMDTVEDKLPLIMGAKIAVGLGKALWGNWQNPNPELAKAAARRGPVRAAQFAMRVSEDYEKFVAAGLIQDMEIDAELRGDAEERDQEEEEFGPLDVRQEPTEENGWREFADREYAEAS